MSRSVWFSAGVAAGAYAVVRARRVAEALTVDGMRDRIGAAFVGARILVEEIDQERVETEHHLRERYLAAVRDQSGPAALNERRDDTPAPAIPAPEKGTY